MKKRELITLDKLLVKLQQHLDAKYVMSSGYEIAISARRIVDREIQSLESVKEPKAGE